MPFFLFEKGFVCTWTHSYRSLSTLHKYANSANTRWLTQTLIKSRLLSDLPREVSIFRRFTSVPLGLQVELLPFYSLVLVCDYDTWVWDGRLFATATAMTCERCFLCTNIPCSPALHNVVSSSTSLMRVLSSPMWFKTGPLGWLGSGRALLWRPSTALKSVILPPKIV